MPYSLYTTADQTQGAYAQAAVLGIGYIDMHGATCICISSRVADHQYA